LAVANLPQTQNPLFLRWRDWRLSLLFPSKPTIEVKCSLIDEYVKKPSAHGTSTFNRSSVIHEFVINMAFTMAFLVKSLKMVSGPLGVNATNSRVVIKGIYYTMD
jgi:hypothetical protein